MTTTLRRTAAAFLTALALSAPAMAQDDEFDLDDLDLGPGMPTNPEPTVAEEKNALLEEDPEGVELENWEKASKKRLIKTLQRKNSLKINRTELSLGGGFVTNDPFINRYIIRLDGTYHFTEITAVQLELGMSPNLGQADWKPITEQIITENRVTPDISKLQFLGNATIQFAPIYGKVALPGNNIINFDIFGLFGSGIAQSADDLDALQCDNANLEACNSTKNQLHPTLNFGGGVRVLVSNNLAFRVEGRGLSYIEVLEGVNLEMKNNIILQASVSYFLGKGK
jgi:outer membrane beta-barrel protein